MHGDNSADETLTTGVKFQINNAKLYVPVVILSINDYIKDLKEQFEKTGVIWLYSKDKATNFK